FFRIKSLARGGGRRASEEARLASASKKPRIPAKMRDSHTAWDRARTEGYHELPAPDSLCGCFDGFYLPRELRRSAGQSSGGGKFVQIISRLFRLAAR